MFRAIQSNLTNLTALAVLTGALSGCTSWKDYFHQGFKVGPDYQPAEAKAAEHWIDAADARVRSEAVDTSKWWTVFNDPVLTAMVTNAYCQNLTLKEAGMRILEARAQLAITAGNFFPQTQDIGGGYTRSVTSLATADGAAAAAAGSVPRGTETWSLGSSPGTGAFNLAWEVDFWGKFRRAVESSEASLNSSVESYDDAMVTLLGDLASNYVTVRTTEERIKLAQANADLQREVLRIVDARFQAGTTSELDVDQAKSNLYQVEAQVPQFQVTIRQATNHLCTLMGVPTFDLKEKIGTGPIPTAPPEVAVGIPAELLSRRPDVRAAERNAAAQSAQIGVAQADLYPHISITGTIGYQSQSFPGLFSGDAFAGSVGPSFQWNVLNYGRIVNNVRYQDAKFRELLLTYRGTVLNAHEETENGLVNFLRSQEQAKILQKSVTAAQKAVEFVITQYKVGTVDFNRVALIETTLVQQQDSLAQAQGQIAQGLIQIYKALGGGWQLRCEKVECLPIEGNMPPAAAPKPPEELPPPQPVPPQPEPKAKVAT
jgi:NodT family efflux transporter outer membrane factor (OMF) lipoprotein